MSLPFDDMQRFVDELRQQILGLRLTNQGFGHDGHAGEEEEEDHGRRRVQSPEVEVVAETLDKSPRLHRKSLIGAKAPPMGDLAPLSPTLVRSKGEVDAKEEGFE